ncbi:cingulin-like [Ambystoma mexicanum]|uniref:cingulin-like n=1 Tax=Ambystoma mexicanum TaxID=8296 RepID=UPI0037E86C60
MDNRKNKETPTAREGADQPDPTTLKNWVKKRLDSPRTHIKNRAKRDYIACYLSTYDCLTDLSLAEQNLEKSQELVVKSASYIIKLKEELACQQQNNADQEAQLEAAKIECQQKVDSLEESQKKLTQQLTYNRCCSGQITMLQNQIDELKEENNKLILRDLHSQTEFVEESQKFYIIKKQRDELAEQRCTLNHEEDALGQEISKLKTELEGSELALQELKELKTEYGKLLEHARRVEGDLEENTQTKDAKTQEMSLLQQKVSQYFQTIQEVQRDNEALCEKNDGLNKRVAAQEWVIEASKTLIAEHKVQIFASHLEAGAENEKLARLRRTPEMGEVVVKSGDGRGKKSAGSCQDSLLAQFVENSGDGRGKRSTGWIQGRFLHRLRQTPEMGEVSEAQDGFKAVSFTETASSKRSPSPSRGMAQSEAQAPSMTAMEKGIASILQEIRDMRSDIAQKFEKIDQRVDKVEDRLLQVETYQSSSATQEMGVELRLAALEKRDEGK